MVPAAQATVWMQRASLLELLLLPLPFPFFAIAEAFLEKFVKIPSNIIELLLTGNGQDQNENTQKFHLHFFLTSDSSKFDTTLSSTRRDNSFSFSLHPPSFDNLLRSFSPPFGFEKQQLFSARSANKR
jgi:hypothetical protein